ncbi:MULTISPECIES: carbon-nitrogen hydrolase family protein [unclassified Mycolicibacterium]|uniref:carbon-nitrogen hydrolase family protein n=1 Tax=unclassified Mycolicibacterium TaxID=2636767 RepID=UPI00192E6C8B|nr:MULTISPECIES: carbon-nitrogen hydrolase family protein [unclassified Mycolicibacterium]
MHRILPRGKFRGWEPSDCDRQRKNPACPTASTVEYRAAYPKSHSQNTLQPCIALSDQPHRICVTLSAFRDRRTAGTNVVLIQLRRSTMSRLLPLTLVQAPAQTLDQFEAGLRSHMASPNAGRMVVYPELHLCTAAVGEDQSEDSVHARYAEPLDGPRGQRLASLARELGIWLVPGTVLERDDDGNVYNTAVVYSPDGNLVASYRKIFTWKPYEKATPGNEFVTFDIPEIGRVGLTICFDGWFPEISRHLAWMGAELILNMAQYPTAGRRLDETINRANAIVNQVWFASVNAAAPTANGQSMLIDPEGHIQAVSPGTAETTLLSLVDFDRVRNVREYGTASDSWPWRQYQPGDAPLPLPLYNGHIDPTNWAPPQPASS